MPDTVSAVLEPRRQLRLFDTPRTEFSAFLLELPEAPSNVVEQSATVLRFVVALAAVTEAVHELELRTVADAIAKIDEVTALACRIARLDVAEALCRGPRLQEEPRALHAAEPPAASLVVVARAVMSLVALCPIENIEERAQRLSLEARGHEARVAYDWLRAFVRRHRPNTDRSTHVACRAYAEGRLSVTEVAELLGMVPSDAVFYLEAHGFCRTTDALRLSQEARDGILRRLRDDRLHRKGAPSPSQDLIARDVISSERIESVDARAWVTAR